MMKKFKSKNERSSRSNFMDSQCFWLFQSDTSVPRSFEILKLEEKQKFFHVRKIEWIQSTKWKYYGFFVVSYMGLCDAINI